MADFPSMIQEYSGCRIAVYGLGIETQKTLPQLERIFKIVGLLDGYREEGELYGQPIIPIAKAIEEDVRLILVVARPGSCRAIARRIGSLCAENGIALLDIKGQDLCSRKNAVYDLKGVRGITKKQLFLMIKDKDAVSFDLFDTLLMRQVLFPADVFELIDCKLKKRGVVIKDFCKRRLESEKNLSRYKAPNLTEIYTYMVNAYSVCGIAPEELAAMEWETDRKLMIPRQEMCGFVKEVYGLGKEIYIVTDTYYTRRQIEWLLNRCGLLCCTDILVSCEYQTGKMQNLFGFLKDRLSGKRYIHIGDDIVADVEHARKKGIEACQIPGGIELLEMAGYLGFWDTMEKLSDRVKVGMLTARLFNSPFQFESDERKLYVKDTYDVGYLFLAPIISDFVLWLDRQTQKDQMQNLWFCARDGYLIKRLYDELRRDMPSVYFLTSRTAAVRAGMETAEDICYVENMRFSGSLQEQLKKRFEIVLPACKEADRLLDCTEEILKASSTNRKNYRTYIKGLDVKKGGIAFFDFVAKGTTQMFIQRLVKWPLKGYYFLWLEEENMREKQLDILPFYSREELEGSAVFQDYYILEAILTSLMPSVDGFDEQGAVCYAEETRKETDIQCIQAVQEGIVDYFKTYLDICESMDIQVNKRGDEIFLNLIHHISIVDENFFNMTVEDPFFNRRTALMDLI